MWWKKTQNNNEMTLTLALSYGGREELANALKQLAIKVKNNIIFSRKKLTNSLLMSIFIHRICLMWIC